MAIINYDGDIHRDTHVYPGNAGNVYAGNGQGCGTVWFKTVDQARKTIANYGGIPKGADAKMCHLCKCAKRYGSPEWEKAPYDYACKNWKFNIAIALGRLDKAGKVIRLPKKEL